MVLTHSFSTVQEETPVKLTANKTWIITAKVTSSFVPIALTRQSGSKLWKNICEFTTRKRRSARIAAIKLLPRGCCCSISGSAIKWHSAATIALISVVPKHCWRVICSYTTTIATPVRNAISNRSQVVICSAIWDQATSCTLVSVALIRTACPARPFISWIPTRKEAASIRVRYCRRDADTGNNRPCSLWTPTAPNLIWTRSLHPMLRCSLGRSTLRLLRLTNAIPRYHLWPLKKK